jgi:hypothetical protein
MADESIDLRGTQGSVVLPGGTVVQNYPSSQTPMPHLDDSHGAREQIEIALLKNDVAAHKYEIRDLWTAVRRLESMLTPRSVDASLFLAIAITAMIAVATIVYLGGNWGG